MTRRSPEKMDVKALVAEFEDPLASPVVEKHEVESDKAASFELTRLANDLNSKSNWKARMDALRCCLSLLKGGIQYYPGGNMKSLAPAIASCLTDLRSGMVKQAALVVAAEAMVLEEDFAPSFDVIFEACMKQINKTGQMANACHLALLQIVRSCQTRKVGKAFLDQYQSQLPAARLVAAEAAHIITETWQPNNAQPLMSQIQCVLAKLVGDPYLAVRTVASQAMAVPRLEKKTRKPPKSSLEYYAPPSKDEKPRPLSPPGSPTGKSPLPSPRRAMSTRDSDEEVEKLDEEIEEPVVMDSPVEQAMDIGSVMPPCSDEEALTFTMELQRIVNEKELDKLKPYVGMLVESVIRAATNSASRDQWEEILEAVLKKYPTSLKGQEMKLMEVFNFEDWIIELVGTYSSLQDLAEKMTLTNTHQIQSGVKFFTQISQMDNTPIDLTDKVKQTMEVLVKKGTKKAAKNKKGAKNEETTKDKDVEVLETVLQAAQPPKDVEGMVNVMVDSLASETAEWHSLLDDLEGLYDGSYAMRKLIEDKVGAVIPGLISDGTDKQRETVIDFITSATQKLKGVSFAPCMEALMCLLFQRKNKLRPKTIDCVSRTLSDVNIMALMIELLRKIENCEKIVLEVLLRYFSEAPPQRLLATHKVIVREIDRYLSSKDAEVRKMAVGILTQFQKKIPKEFNRQLQKLAPTQKKLIELGAKKTPPAKAT